eukprot:TRINITY_DN28915_c0_g3_i1.p1 TRINITY_DN28915_c0_g3~~TRINITY_DN28915_c0_g3_i1.p1  ORF type:complete len:896 (-),score=279.40 TRINITY_DN28915_c0_g3_i1:1251-3938(-)
MQASSLEQQGVPGLAGLVLRADPDGTLAAHRAFVLADAAADAAGRVHIGALQTHLYAQGAARSRGPPVRTGRQDQPGGVVGPYAGPGAGKGQVIVARGQGAGPEGLAADCQLIARGGPGGQAAEHRGKGHPGEDGLGAHRAVLLAHDARPVHGPGQTAPPVHKGHAQTDGPRGCELALPQLLGQADGPDGRAGADVRAGHAAGLATAGADGHVEHRGPHGLQAEGRPGRLQHAGGADPHALAAAQTAAQELAFRQRARRPDQTGVPVRAQQAAQAQQGWRGQAQPQSGQHPPPAQVGQGLAAGRGPGLIGYGRLGAGVQAVEAEHALLGPQLARGPGRARAGRVAVQAAAAARRLFAHPEQAVTPHQPQQGAGGAHVAAKETGPPQVEQQKGQEHRRDQGRALVEAGLGPGDAQRGVGQGQQGQVDRAGGQGDGVQQPGQERGPAPRGEDAPGHPQGQEQAHCREVKAPALPSPGGGQDQGNDQGPGHKGGDLAREQAGGQVAGRGAQKEGQQEVLDLLGRMGGVAPHPLLLVLGVVAQPAQELVHGPKGADPAAEKAPHHQGQGQDQRAPDQAGVERAPGQQGGQAAQGVQLQKPVHRPAAPLPQALTDRGHQAEPQEQGQKEGLANASGAGDAHQPSSTRVGFKDRQSVVPTPAAAARPSQGTCAGLSPSRPTATESTATWSVPRIMVSVGFRSSKEPPVGPLWARVATPSAMTRLGLIMRPSSLMIPLMSWWNTLRRPPSRPYQFFMVTEAWERWWSLTGARPMIRSAPCNGPQSSGQFWMSRPPGRLQKANAAGWGRNTRAPAARAAGPMPESSKQEAGSLMGLSVTVTSLAPALRHKRTSSATSSGLVVAPRAGGLAKATLALITTLFPACTKAPSPPRASNPARRAGTR